MAREINDQLLGQALRAIGSRMAEGVEPPIITITQIKPVEIPREAVVKMAIEQKWNTLPEITRATMNLREKAAETRKPEDQALYNAVLEYAQEQFPLKKILKEADDVLNWRV